MRYPLLYELPIWVIGVLLVVALLGALEAGYRVVRWKGPAWKTFDSRGGGGVVLTSMFALLGLMLSSISESQSQTRVLSQGLRN
ncbi:MAG: hypothetical protein WCH75_15260 [Candidatus Binatia bacterium]